jgi:pimeloyl-ACP methyl ester carboxylesterase
METVRDQSQGVQLATIQALARYWETKYDWRKCEAQLKALPQFITEIDGLDIHFIHVRSKHENALPIIVTHGWPGSIIEQLKIIGPLTDPSANGGSAADAFDVVIPSMPGFGFSGKPTEPGWGPDRISRAWVELMRRLGYPRYVATGGDWGVLITDLIGLEAPPELLGIHTNFPGAVPPEIELAAITGNPVTEDLSAEEQREAEKLSFVYKHVYYAFYMASRPQTLTGLVDSPVGLAAFMIDHDGVSYELIARSIAGEPEGLTPDDILDNITLFWLTKTAVSAARIYWENKFAFFSAKGVSVPVAVSVFPDELYQAPRSWAQKAYPTSSTTTRSKRAGTSRPGSSRSCSRKSFARRSGRSASRARAGRSHAWVRPSDEGELPSLDGATGWLNSQPLTPARLRRKVVLVSFWTYTCINWLRQLPWLHAWAEKYSGHGADSDRRAQPGVLLRAPRRQRPPGGAGDEDHLPGRGR